MSGGRVRRHSVTLQGHRTSISLEDLFWRRLRAIAAERGQSINALVAEIDAGRDPDTLEAGNLSSALRVFVLEHALDGAQAPESD